jgi:hypothetical protein
MTSTQDFNTGTNVKNTEGEISFSPSFSLDAKPVDTDELWRKVYSSITTILTRRFADDRKRKIKPFTDRIAFACPYCGDSSKDMSKKRGNVFVESMNYHCFNGDCNTHMSLYYFLKDQGEIDVFSPEEKTYMQQQTAEHAVHTGFKKIRISQDIESLLSEEAMSLTVSREYFVKFFKLQEIRGSRIERYLKQRLQTDFHKFAFDPRKGLLYVMNLTKDGSRLFGYQIKTFNKRNPYLTYKTSGMHKELKIYKEQNKELLEKLDTIASIFGISNLDLNKTVTVFEGPLDSFLFPNSVGVCSAKNDFPFEVESIRYFYDNDATGKDWAMKKMEQGFPVFLWRKYIQDNELAALETKIKDLNDLLIEANRRQLKLKKFVDFFSTDKYDMIWL